jgi:hypothetical protein
MAGSIRRILTGVSCGCLAFFIGFHIGMAVYTLTPLGLIIPTDIFAGAFPGVKAAFCRSLK